MWKCECLQLSRVMISQILPVALKFRGQRWPHRFEFVWAWYWLNAFWFAKQVKHTKCVAT